MDVRDGHEVKELIGKPGAIPLLSLGGACPCLMCGTLIRLVDSLLSVYLKIDGHGIQKASIGRRVASRLRDIGLQRSARSLALRYGTRKGRGRSLVPHPELDLKTPVESSSASGDPSGSRSSTPAA